MNVVKFLLQGLVIGLKSYNISAEARLPAKIQGACAPFAPMIPTPLYCESDKHNLHDQLAVIVKKYDITIGHIIDYRGAHILYVSMAM